MSNTDFGYGQIGPDDGSTDLNSIVAVARRLIERLDTTKLVSVVAVTAGSGSPPAAGTVDVQLLVNQVDGNFFGVNHGIVHGLRYFRLQAGPWALIADPVVGDVGFVIVPDRDSSLVTGSGAMVNPGSRRRYNIADGIYVGGILNAVPAATIWLKSDGTWVLTDKPGNVLKGDSNGFTMSPNGSTGLTVNGPITSTGKITGTDFSDGTVTSYKVHTHGGVTTGAGLTGTPTPGS